MLHRSASTLKAGFVAAVALATPVMADVRFELSQAIEFGRLKTELGGSMPTGFGVTASTVEAPEGVNNYIPFISNTDRYGTKTFHLESGASSPSGHSDGVAQNFYSDNDSIAPGITDVYLYEVNDWLENTLNVGQAGVAPSAALGKVQNHSWAGDFGSDALDADALRRLDYSINQNDTVVVVATSNDYSTNIPRLLTSTYNGITVGLSNGLHGAGNTSFDAPGRIKPDIVVSAGHLFDLTSFATPVVAAASALLVETGMDMGSANAQHSETIKAVLMAGAKKRKVFGDWDRTQSRPLDDRYGSGQLNIHRSYHILAAGEQEAGNSTLAKIGWDFNTTSSGSTRKYFFELTQTEEETSIVLTWNRLVDNPDAPGFDTQAFLPNLDLKLSTASGLVIGSMLDQSISTVDNVELIYLEGLSAGRYVIEVSSGTADIDYAIAWTNVPEPSAAVVLLLAFPLARRRRRLTA